MTLFYLDDQNPSGFSFFWKLRASAFQTSPGLLNLNVKGKTKSFLVVVVKWRHIWNGRGKLGTRLAETLRIIAHADASHSRSARNKCLLPGATGCAGDRVEMVVKVHCGTFWGTNLLPCWEFVPKNTLTMHFETISTRSPAQSRAHGKKLIQVHQTFLGILACLVQILLLHVWFWSKRFLFKP